MDNQLSRAWRVLTRDERPAFMDEPYDPYAYYRLIVAVEDALLRVDDGSRKWLLTMHGDEYVWSHVSRGLKFGDKDRLTAAVLALEAWRGGK